MDFDSRVLYRELSELLRWERRKRRERILAEVLFYALLGALIALPVHGFLPTHAVRWFIPALFIAALAPVFFLRGRWRPLHSARVLARLDKSLRLEERAITAWELLERKETGGPALLLFKEAGEKINPVDARAVFARRWNWQAYAALPLFVLWFALLWFDVELRFGSGLPAPATLAHTVREFSQELQEKAKSDGLRESLQWGRELEKAAQKGVEAKTGDDQFKSELAGIAKRMETAGKPGADAHQALTAAESEQHLKDLKAEVDAARDLLNFPGGAKGAQGSGQQWLDRLAALPQLRKQFDAQGQGRTLGQNELKAYLDKLNDQVTRELDRRTLLDAQQFLEQLTKQGRGEKGETEARVAGRGEQRPTDGEKAKSKGDLPGDEPGSREDVPPAPPQFQAGAATQLKGLLAEGASSGLVFKGKPSPGKSEISQEEVVASYRRQAEAELETEQVPESLKDIIKHYFLSLGMGEERKSTMGDPQPVERR